MRTRRMLLIALGCAGTTLMLGTAADAANVVIVRAAGPSAKAYPPGKALPDSAKIALQPGDMVTLVGPRSTRTLRGPGTFSAGSSAAGLAMAANRRSRFGALRTGDLALNPSPWNLDVTQSGKMCVAEPSKLLLWRPNSEEPAIISINGGASTQSLEWVAGKATVAWPTSLPITSGTEYELQLAGSTEKSRVSIVIMPAIPTEATTIAQALIERGCQNQLDVLVAGLDKEAE